MKKRKLLEKLLSGSKNIQFNDMVGLIQGFGFSLSRINGSHHIFTHPDVPDFINIQNRKGQVPPYQVRQFLSLIEQYNLQLEDEREEP